MHRETVQDRSKADTHLEREGYGRPPEKLSAEKRLLTHLGRAVLPGLCLLLVSILLCFPHLPCPRILPKTHVQLLSKMDSSPEPCEGVLGLTYYGMAPPSFLPQRRLSGHVQHLPSPKGGKYVTSWSFKQIEFSLAVIVILSVHRDKVQLLTLFFSFPPRSC